MSPEEWYEVFLTEKGWLPGSKCGLDGVTMHRLPPEEFCLQRRITDQHVGIRYVHEDILEYCSPSRIKELKKTFGDVVSPDCVGIEFKELKYHSHLWIDTDDDAIEIRFHFVYNPRPKSPYSGGGEEHPRNVLVIITATQIPSTGIPQFDRSEKSAIEILKYSEADILERIKRGTKGADPYTLPDLTIDSLSDMVKKDWQLERIADYRRTFI